jgi:hypothetical protein
MSLRVDRNDSLHVLLSLDEAEVCGLSCDGVMDEMADI